MLLVVELPPFEVEGEDPPIVEFDEDEVVGALVDEVAVEVASGSSLDEGEDEDECECLLLQVPRLRTEPARRAVLPRSVRRSREPRRRGGTGEGVVKEREVLTVMPAVGDGRAVDWFWLGDDGLGQDPDGEGQEGGGGGEEHLGSGTS